MILGHYIQIRLVQVQWILVATISVDHHSLDLARARSIGLLSKAHREVLLHDFMFADESCLQWRQSEVQIDFLIVLQIVLRFVFLAIALLCQAESCNFLITFKDFDLLVSDSWQLLLRYYWFIWGISRALNLWQDVHLLLTYVIFSLFLKRWRRKSECVVFRILFLLSIYSC